MEVTIHKPSGSIYPYNKKNPKYCKGMGSYSLEVLEVIKMSAFKFYPLYLHQEYIHKKKLIYSLLALFPWKIRKLLYKHLMKLDVK